MTKQSSNMWGTWWEKGSTFLALPTLRSRRMSAALFLTQGVLFHVSLQSPLAREHRRAIGSTVATSLRPRLDLYTRELQEPRSLMLRDSCLENSLLKGRRVRTKVFVKFRDECL